MLKSLKIKNFYSFGEEQSLSLEVNAKDVLDDSTRKYKRGEFLNTTACVIGANASGKTNVLKALCFLAWFIEKSYSSLKPGRSIPIELHQLHPRRATSFKIEFFEGDILYRYYLKLNKKEVLEERLDKKVGRWNKVPVFELSRNSKEATLIHYSGKKKLNKDDWDRIKQRNNISLLSALIDLHYLPEITFFKNTVVVNVDQGGNARTEHFEESLFVSQRLYKDKELQKEVLSFSKEIDLGISEFGFRHFGLRENVDDDEKTQILECKHTTGKKSFTLQIFEESNGTQRSYAILSHILPILRKGGLVVIDEIEDGLHPHVTKKIVSLFSSKETNPNDAQLIFTTHQHILLNDRTKTQIFIAEKSKEKLETELYRLDEIEGIRNDENYFQKYMIGVYGGTPEIKWL